MLGVTDGQELAGIAAAAGLASNLRLGERLADGIQRGPMGFTPDR
jgi:hydroxymethylglutaryl-CoA reductase